ncbi:MAG: hypothetical protein P8Y69_01275 [Gammaproteobacteria bacterium]
MLTKADDYPIHQTPEPIAYSGSNRNFYDRYFFNGYERDGELFFAAALGVYPHLNVLDAAFSLIREGRQHNVFASRILHDERLDTRVGPIAVEVIEPLEALALRVDDPDSGIRADVTFRARFPAIQEPRFTRHSGTMLVMDSTRMTQNGTYEGWVEADGQRIPVSQDAWWGTRDRSWGIRAVGQRDPQPNPHAEAPQFFWLWAPLNFDEFATFYHLNAEADGTPWNTAGRIVTAAESRQPAELGSHLVYRSGTRHAERATITLGAEADRSSISLTPTQTFYMKGIGYGHPEWSHGLYHGELETAHETWELTDLSPADPGHFHIQAICDAEFQGADGVTRRGKGVLEQLVIGPYAPYGFKDLVDLAP